MSDDDDENDERGHDLHVPYNKILNTVESLNFVGDNFRGWLKF